MFWNWTGTHTTQYYYVFVRVTSLFINRKNGKTRWVSLASLCSCNIKQPRPEWSECDDIICQCNETPTHRDVTKNRAYLQACIIAPSHTQPRTHAFHLKPSNTATQQHSNKSPRHHKPGKVMVFGSNCC